MNDIVVSEIQIIPVKPKDGLVAFASCVIDNQFYVGDIAIYTRPDGRDHRLVYPCKILPNGKRINCFHPINQDAGESMKKAIIDKYLEMVSKCKMDYD
jgi:DNA-binding cell septation regulator SpoVG